MNKDIYDTKQKGNLLLENVFTWLHNGEYSKIPPFFIFSKADEKKRDVKFLGLAVPGNPLIPFGQDLERARDKDGNEVNNFVAKFTIIDTTDSEITYEWLNALLNNKSESISLAPESWKNFLSLGLDGIKPLKKNNSNRLIHRQSEIEKK